MYSITVFFQLFYHMSIIMAPRTSWFSVKHASLHNKGFWKELRVAHSFALIWSYDMPHLKGIWHMISSPRHGWKCFCILQASSSIVNVPGEDLSPFEEAGSLYGNFLGIKPKELRKTPEMRVKDQ